MRKPKGYAIQYPGDLVGLDTLEIRLDGDTRPYQQSPHEISCPAGTPSSSPVAPGPRPPTAVLDALEARMPFGVRAFQGDGGSESMAGFEAECAGRRIALFVLPPRSPRLNGHVERANGTHREESWQVTDAEPDLDALRQALLEWETCYNTVRPHQALGYLTPPNGSNEASPRLPGWVPVPRCVAAPSALTRGRTMAAGTVAPRRCGKGRRWTDRHRGEKEAHP